MRLLTGMHPTFSQLREILQYLLLVKVKEGKLPLDELSSSHYRGPTEALAEKKNTSDSVDS